MGKFCLVLAGSDRSFSDLDQGMASWSESGHFSHESSVASHTLDFRRSIGAGRCNRRLKPNGYWSTVTPIFVFDPKVACCSATCLED